MTEFYQQYFCPSNEKFSVIIEDDGKVAYAYLLSKKEIISDVWLYNQEKTPKSINWQNRNNMPFLNPQNYILDKFIAPLNDRTDVSLDWNYIHDLIEVKLYIRNEMIAILEPNAFPGWSVLAKIDGPLAKKINLNES